MKITLFFILILSSAFTMPQIHESWDPIGRFQPAMTPSSIRMYFQKEQRRRAALRTRHQKILEQYFQLRDSKN